MFISRKPQVENRYPPSYYKWNVYLHKPKCILMCVLHIHTFAFDGNWKVRVEYPKSAYTITINGLDPVLFTIPVNFKGHYL